MTTIEKLIILKSRYQKTMMVRIKRLENMSEKISLGGKPSKNIGLLNSIHNEIHKLAGSSKPFGYAKLSDKVKELLVFVVKLTSGEIKTTDDRLKDIQDSIAGLNKAIKKDEQKEDSTSKWALITEPKKENDPLENNNKIILMDEDEEFTDQLSFQLQEYGFEVKVPYIFSELRMMLKKFNPAALLMDSNLLEGWHKYRDKTEDLKKEFLPELNVICLSFDSSFEARLKAIRTGIDGYFVKPFDTSDFINYLDQKAKKIDEIPLRVLIIDDDTEIAQLNAYSLQQNNVKTFIINDPLNTLSAMVSFKPDILLVDIQMPHCSGFELAQVIRQNNKFINIPIIFLTGHVIDDAWKLSKDSGGDDFISKDISTEHLVNTITARAKRSRTLFDATERVAEKKAWYDKFSNATGDGIITTDSEQRIVFWNKGAENLCGYSRQEVFGHHIEILFPEEERSKLLDVIEKMETDEEKNDGNITFTKDCLHKDGSSIPCEITISRWVLKGKKYHTGIYRDIRHRAEPL